MGYGYWCTGYKTGDVAILCLAQQIKGAFPV
jgi:hypothetical protein